MMLFNCKLVKIGLHIAASHIILLHDNQIHCMMSLTDD